MATRIAPAHPQSFTHPVPPAQGLVEEIQTDLVPVSRLTSTQAAAHRAYAAQVTQGIQLVRATPRANALATVPTDWFPNGSYNRDFSAYLKGVWVPGAGGTARIRRSRDTITASAKGMEFSLQPDPNDPGQVVADTPQGRFRGSLTRRGDRVVFRTADGRRSVTMEAGSSWTSGNYLEISTRGFGFDSGSITVPR